MRRFAAILLALIALPQVFVRVSYPSARSHAGIWIHNLMPGLIASGLPVHYGPFALAGAWQIGGDDPAVANCSALGVLANGDFVSLSDRGALLTFSRPDRPGVWFAHDTVLLPPNTEFGRQHSDGEAMVVVPPHDDLLMIYESTPDLVRFTRDLRHYQLITVPALAAWPENQGPEASTRLRDGRMVMLEEGYAPWWDTTGHEGLVFAGLPHDGEVPGRFHLTLPAGWRPTELANLPDGRVLLLERRFTLTGFRTALALIDPAAIHPGAQVVPKPLARIDDPRIRDNYEGMTVTREPDGALAVWIISDSNEMVLLQRTLLLKLRIAAPL